MSMIISEFEELILLAVLKLGQGAYGVSIGDAIEAATGRSVSFGKLYTAFSKLEQNGFVKTRMGDPTPERGGRAKRFVEITGKGEEVLRTHQARRTAVFAHLQPQGV